MMPEAELRAALAELAAWGKRAVVPAAIEVQLRRALPRCAQSRRPRHGLGWLALAAALCLGVAAGWWSGRLSGHRRAPPPPTQLTFRLLPYADPPAAIHNPQVRRVLLRPEDFAALGLPPQPLDATALIAAELLVNDDGTPEAIRFSNDEQ